MGLFLIYYPRNDVALLRLGLLEWRFLPEAISSGWLILFYIAWDIWGAVSGGDGIGYISHVIGMVLGIGIAVTLLKTRLIDTPYGEENLLQVFGWAPETGREERRRRKKRVVRKTKRAAPPRIEERPNPPGDVHGWG